MLILGFFYIFGTLELSAISSYFMNMKRRLPSANSLDRFQIDDSAVHVGRKLDY